MKVIILKTSQVKEVPLGYAVNYLLPKKLAVIATAKKVKELEEDKLKDKLNQQQNRQQNRQMAEKLDGKVIEFKAKAGKSGKIHGAITKKEIAGRLEISKTNIILEKPIKKVGQHEVELKFGSASAKIKIKVEANDEKES